MAGANGLSTNGSSADLEYLFQTLWKEKGTGAWYRLCWKSPAGQFSSGRWFSKNQLKTELLECISSHAGDNIYWQCAGADNIEIGAQKQGCLAPGFLWVDMDGGAGPADVVPLPTMAWETSAGKWQGVWIISDGYMTEDLNKRLTYYLRADRACWKQNQVLRVPGTVNYGDPVKGLYSPPHHGRMIWSDGPTYTLGELERLIPPIDEVTARVNSSGVLKARVPPRLQQILKRPATKGNRSDVFHLLVRGLREAKFDLDGVEDVLRGNSWAAKYESRGVDGLRRAIESSWSKDPSIVERKKEEKIDAIIRGEGKGKGGTDGWVSKLKGVEDLDTRRGPWIWFPYVRVGELSMMTGYGDSCKSWLAFEIAKHVLDGTTDTMPSLQPSGIMGKVMICTQETGEDILDERFTKLDCRTYIDRHIQAVRNGFRRKWKPLGEQRWALYSESFSLTDMDTFADFAREVVEFKPKLVILDTIHSYLAGTDTHRANEVTNAMLLLKKLAAEVGCAMILVNHFNKGTDEKTTVVNKSMGSAAFGNTARNGMVVAKIKEGKYFEEDYSGVWNGKNNNVRTDLIPPGQMYRIREETFYSATCINSRKVVIKQGTCFEWCPDVSELSADYVVKNQHKGGVRGGRAAIRSSAAEWLRSKLADGPMNIGAVKRLAETELSFSWETLKRAAKTIGVVTLPKGPRRGHQKFWTWSLPVVSGG